MFNIPWLHPGYFLRPGIAFHEAILKYLRIFWNNALAIFWRYRNTPQLVRKALDGIRTLSDDDLIILLGLIARLNQGKWRQAPNGSCRLVFLVLLIIWGLIAPHLLIYRWLILFLRERGYPDFWVIPTFAQFLRKEPKVGWIRGQFPMPSYSAHFWFFRIEQSRVRYMGVQNFICR